MTTFTRISMAVRENTRTVLWTGLAVAFLLVLIQAGVLLVEVEESVRTVTNDIVSAMSSVLAAAGMGYAVWWSRRISPALGRAWVFFMLAMVCWALGDILWAYFELVLGEVPYPSAADLAYLSIYPLFLAGILRLPRPADTPGQVAWLWLDLSIIMFSAIGIYWNFLIGPVVLVHDQPWLEVLVNSAYPAGDLLLILVMNLIVFLPRSHLWRTPLYLMLAGHGLSAVGDSIYAYQTINEVYASSAFFNILFSVGPLLLMLSGLSQAARARQLVEGRRTVPVVREVPQAVLLRLIIPFVWLLISYFLLGFGAASKQAMSALQFSVWMCVLIVLLAVRQALSFLDNRRLAGELRGANDQLEKRVAERSKDLLLANSDLRREMEERKRIEMMLREREENLAHFALHDGLTGLPNRSLLIDRITQAIQRHRRYPDDQYAVLFLDLDSFKEVNDSLGHLAGDQLLIQVSQRLSARVRGEDTVARLGGDEFVILLNSLHDRQFPSVKAGRILEELREPFLLDDKPIYITASVGVVIADPQYSTAIEILRDADLAMYEAKSGGKARSVVFSSDLHLSAINRLSLNSDLHQALRLNEFVLFYQPVVALDTGRISGFEALIRWRHPARGLVGPSEFIPVAESSGLIHSITEWTIREACRQLAEWRRSSSADPDLTVRVNLSPHSLRKPELFGWVTDALQRAGLPPACLVLEIVETALIQDADLAKRAFSELRRIGIGVSLDDFGIGYSSLGYINQYPIDELKIDQSFIRRLTQGREVDAIVRAVTRLAGELDLRVVAEGIEMQAQYDFLQQTGCKFGQGYLMSRPLDSDGIALLLERESLPTTPGRS